MCAQIGELCGLTADQIRPLLLDSGLQLDFERGKFTQREFHREMERLVSSSLDFDSLMHAGANIFDLDEGTAGIVQELQRQGMRLVLLSNTHEGHFEFIQRNFSVLDHFDDFVLSYKVGALKPEPAIFEAALAKIGCPPDRCFYTDDIAPYVEAGRTHGLQAEQFTTAVALRGHLATRGVSV
jgi:putative hydrolase of the HAD superfamily